VTRKPTSEEARPDTLREMLQADRRPLIIAHRGASAAAPENTAPAFRLALEADADLVELDYHHSADGIPVVIHDKTLERTTDAENRWGKGRHAVSARRWEELRELDAGAWFDPSRPDSRDVDSRYVDSRYVDVRLPRLEDALAQIQSGSWTLIERKAGDAATLVALLKRLDLLEHVVVQAFDWDFLESVRALAPEALLGALGKGPLSQAQWTRLSRMKAHALGWRHRDVTRAFVADANERGLPVWVYTVDDPERGAELVALGVEGIITNRPAEMRRALRTAD
jgi:glycerophosphoryl diester phosphodiesterase